MQDRMKLGDCGGAGGDGGFLTMWRGIRGRSAWCRLDHQSQALSEIGGQPRNIGG